jgi:superfamily II DNA or RNA helicase
MDEQRNFAAGERKAIRRVFNHTCSACGAEVTAENAQADHVIAYANGGSTTLDNAQLLCRDCNQSKGATNGVRPSFAVAKPSLDFHLRAWQKDCLSVQAEVIANGGKTFFLGAGVGSGKTIASLAAYIQGDFDLLIVVTTKSGIRGTWHKDAEKVGLKLKTMISATDFMADDGTRKVPHGFVLNVHMVPSLMNDLRLLCKMFKVLLVLDEAHHYGESLAWTRNLSATFGDVSHTMHLSGTPYRGDNQRILGLNYAKEGQRIVGEPDFKRSYEDNVGAGEAAPIITRFVSGSVTKMSAHGMVEVYDYDDGDYSTLTGAPSPALMSTRLRLSAVESIDWQMAAVAAARADLMECRKDGIRWGGLIICTEIEQAKEVAIRINSRWGDKVKLIVAEVDTETAVEDFIDDESYTWAVSITKVSEGISIDRLRVGVMLSTTLTRGNFDQVRGRLARLVKGIPHVAQAAHFYIPADPRLIDYALSSNKMMLHSIPWLRDTNAEAVEDLVIGCDVVTEADIVRLHDELTADADTGVDGAEIERGHTTIEQINALRMALKRTSDEMTIRIGDYTLFAKAKIDGAAIDDEFISESEYLELRQRMAEIINPLTAARMRGAEIDELSDIFGGV